MANPIGQKIGSYLQVPKGSQVLNAKDCGVRERVLTPAPVLVNDLQGK